MEGGAKPFSSWKLNDEHNLTVLVKGGLNFFKLQEGGDEPKSKPTTEFPELVFTLSIAWSLIDNGKPQLLLPLLPSYIV